MNISSQVKMIIKKLPLPVLRFLWIVSHPGSKIPDWRLYQSVFRGQRGIEIGGPSLLFATQTPIYQIVGSLDGANFSDQTLWEGRIQNGGTYNYARGKSGTQFVAEATDLSGVDSNSYDFVISSNCLEHVANPLKAVGEWKRVLKVGGYLLVIVPRKEGNFDHKRPFTSITHLRQDHHDDVQEDDLTHLEEILQMHDLSRDRPAGTLEEFRARSAQNFSNRALHHHVFSQALLDEVLVDSGFHIVNIDQDSTNIFALAQRIADHA
jgi:SAM-dependent methyltransferase